MVTLCVAIAFRSSRKNLEMKTKEMRVLSLKVRDHQTKKILW